MFKPITARIENLFASIITDAGKNPLHLPVLFKSPIFPKNMRMTPKTKTRLFKISAALLGLFVAFLLGEIALRLLLPKPLASTRDERGLFCRFDREIGWVPVENFSGRHTRDGFSVLVHQNTYGLRGPDDMRPERSSTKRRVLVLGDSYVWGFGVNQTELFTAPEVHRADLELLNFGVSGYGNDQEYLFYQRLGTRFDVDEVVLALTPYNDIENNLAAEQYGCCKPYFTLTNQLALHQDHIRINRLRTFANFLAGHSRVLGLASGPMNALEKWLKRSRNAVAAESLDRELKPADISPRDREGVELTVAILKQLRDAVRARHAEFSVIFIPYKPHIRRHLPDNHPLVPLIADGLARAGINYREPYPEFLKQELAGTANFHELDNHFSAAGHELFAKFFTDTALATNAVNYYQPKL